MLYVFAAAVAATVPADTIATALTATAMTPVAAKPTSRPLLPLINMVYLFCESELMVCRFMTTLNHRVMPLSPLCRCAAEAVLIAAGLLLYPRHRESPRHR